MNTITTVVEGLENDIALLVGQKGKIENSGPVEEQFWVALWGYRARLGTSGIGRHQGVDSPARHTDCCDARPGSSGGRP